VESLMAAISADDKDIDEIGFKKAMWEIDR
jgi:hypothetical protein